MKPSVEQRLGDIERAHAGLFLQLLRRGDELVAAQLPGTAFPRNSRDLNAQVVRVEHGELRDALETVGAVGVEYAKARTACAKFDQNERIGPIDFGRSKSSRRAASRRPVRRLANDDRRRQVLDEVRRDAQRTVARAAAAVRNGERLVRVEMHQIEAHVAGPRVAHQSRWRSRRRSTSGRPPRAPRPRISRYRSSKRPSVFGLVIMQTAVSGPSTLRSSSTLDAPALVAVQRNHFEPAHRRRRRIGAVRGIRNDDLVARGFAAVLEVALGDEQRAELRVRAGRRVERERRHAEERAQAMRSSSYITCSAPLRQLVGREGMQLRELAAGSPSRR